MMKSMKGGPATPHAGAFKGACPPVSRPGAAAAGAAGARRPAACGPSEPRAGLENWRRLPGLA